MENGSSNNRRRARLETSQSASASAMGVRLACEIRNYCRLGVYLQFSEAHEAQAAAAAWRKGTLVEVEFTATAKGQPQLLRVLGSVAHITPAGTGLAVPSMSPEALLALQAASPSASPSAAVVPKQPLMAAPQTHGNVEPGAALQAQCMALFKSGIQGVLDELFAGLDATFEQAHDKSTDATDRKWLREAPPAIRFARTRIEKAFFASALEYQQQLQQEAAEGSANATAASSTDELSLLEESEFEDWLNLTSAVNRLEQEGAYGPSLVLVERRYGQFMGRALDSRRNPFGPAMICQYLQQAARDPVLNNCTRAVLYRAFGQVLERHLPSVVEPLAQVLSAWGDEQQVPLTEASGASTSQRRTGASPAHDNGHQELLPADSPAQGTSAASPSPDAAAAGPLDQSLLAVARTLLRAVEQGRGAVPAPASEDHRVAAGHPMPARAGGPAGFAELAALIDAMPLSGWTGLRQAVQTPFSAQLASAGGGLSIPHHAQNALDSAASLLVRAQGVSGGGQAIDTLLRRLEQPLLKLSLREHGFLDQADHPARQLVDLLEQFAIAVDDDGRFLDPTLQRFLHKAIERVWQRADQDAEIFARTRDSMSRLLEPLRQNRQARVSRVLEACESRHRFRQARQRVDRALHVRLGGRQVPQIVRSLLDAGWRQALVLLEFRVGEEAEQWRRELTMVDHLVALLAPDDGVSPVDQRRAALAAASHIETLLASVNSDVDQRDALMADLQRALEGASNGQATLPSARYATASATADTPAVAETGDPAAPRRDADPTPAPPLSSARVGDWWFVRKDSAWVPMQLIWTSSTAQDCALTNRSATRHLELTLQDFHKRLREGTIKAWSDQAQPLVERSVHAMLDEGRQQVLQRSLRDPVTGLLSRKGFLQHLAQARACRTGEFIHMLAIIEFDQFRVVSQACGAAQGDALSRALSAEVQATVGPHGVLASFRDDTIALFLPEGRRAQGLARLDDLLQKLSDYRFQTGGNGFSIGVNIGVAEFTPGLHEPDAAVQQADMACVAAKTQGRNRLQCFESESRHLRSQQDLVDWAGRIDSLLGDSLSGGSGLFLRGQRIMPITAESGLQPYHEVLLGIELEAGRTLAPMPFVLAVEGLRRAHELDLWVLHKAFDWIRRNPTAFGMLGGFSINLSAMSLAHTEVISMLQRHLLAGDIPAHRISFEITETAAIHSYGAAADFIRQMRRFGCHFALDDFGSGHTSYAHLKNLRADVLKIDGSFVKDIVDSPADYAIVKSMNDIAHSLGMRTVAEYVESPAILARLREIGVDYAQGYAIHKPEHIDRLLARPAPRQQPDGAATPQMTQTTQTMQTTQKDAVAVV